MTQVPSSPRPTRTSHILKSLVKPLTLLLGYCLFVTWFEIYCLHNDLQLSGEVQAVASLFIGSLMALRINTSYSHWWEARTLWGRLVNEERNMAAYVAALAEVPPAAKETMREILVAFPPTLMRHLREVPGPVHRPSELSGRAFRELGEWKRLGYIDGWEWSRLGQVLESLLAVCGGCERIRNSLLMRSYHAVVVMVIALYLAAAPFALETTWWTTPVVMIGGALFLALEQVAADIEEPFGTAPEDIPSENLCATIEKTVNQLLTAPAPASQEVG